MKCTIVGPGLVGSYLGAACGAETYLEGHRPRAREILLPTGPVTWEPRPIGCLQQGVPTIVCSRLHQTNWSMLPQASLAAQNGVETHIPTMACFMAVDMEPDGLLRAVGPRARLVIPPCDEAFRPVIEAWRSSNLIIEECADCMAPRWEKLILNLTVGPLALATGWSMTRIWADRPLRALVLQATDEAVALCRADGIDCDPHLADTASGFFAKVGDHQPSVCRDPGELPYIFAPVRSLMDRIRTPCPAIESLMRRVQKGLSVGIGDALSPTR